MAVVVLTGQQDDATILSNRRVIDMSPVISQLDPEQSQFSTLLMKLATRPAFSQKVEWIEDQYVPRVATLAVTATSGTGTIVVSASQGNFFKAGDICRIVSTGEAFSVASVSADTLTVNSRALGLIGTASAATGTDVVIIGNASLEGGSLPTRKVTQKTPGYNYCQIVRSSYGFTNTLAASKLYGGPEPDVERRKKAVEHKRQLESTLFFGARSLVTSATAHPQASTGGAIEYIASGNVASASSVPKATFDGYLDTLYAHGDSNSKIAFAAPLPARLISTYASTGLGSAWGFADLASASAKFGVHVDGFVSGAYGYNLPIVVKREWNDMTRPTTATITGYGGFVFMIDTSMTWYRPLRNTVLLTNRQANDADAVDEEYLTEASLEFQQPSAHFLIEDFIA